VRFDVLEVFFQVFGYRVVVAQHRQHVDEAEHLDFDGFVVHRPVHQAIFPPTTMEDGRRAMIQPSKQVFADFSRSLFNSVFDANTFGHGVTEIPLNRGSESRKC
jgi:hypothetical protein